ncbi:hypothetical protein BGZ60DRAFT_404421 [Tricladium varicosporioides]|nr:hypothetical protein BGZ60DRAFT_404421 [Hymenoscyphus varicosporioides]
MDIESSESCSSSPTSRSCSSPNLLLICPLCQKPYSVESSYRRHVIYCRRTQSRPKSRQRSCRPCNSAKAKCTFEATCGRCRKKGLQCIYEKSFSSSGTRSHSKDKSDILDDTNSDAITPPQEQSQPSGDGNVLDSTFSNNFLDLFLPSTDTMEQLPLHQQHDPVFDKRQVSSSQPFDISSQPFENSMIHHIMASSSCPLQESRPSKFLWSFWENQENYFSSYVDMYEHYIPRPHALSCLRMANPVAQNNATLLMQSLRSFPAMVLRKETFPPLIHSHNALLPPSNNACLPAPLAICMSIAQIFASRTPETQDFLWSTIRSEQQRLADQIQNLSGRDAFAAVQASSIYVIMRVVDGACQTQEQDLQMLLHFQDLCEGFKCIFHEPFSLTEDEKPSSNWDDWVFAESRRRVSCLWFLIGRIVSIRTGIQCDAVHAFRVIPLPSPKSVWEARHASEWESERDHVCRNLNHGMTTFGDLIDAHRGVLQPSNARRLDIWNAGADNLSSLLNLAVAMV